ncbi:MAG TPA: endo-1,4-beta-xylanase [Rhizomicrobium sp.]|jgi:endo-1,4-beta-xylanase
MNRREFLLQSAALMTAGTDGPLRAAAARRGLLYGAATNTTQLQDADFADALVREAAILVPEYEMKRGVVETRPGRYDFSGMDKLAGFARANGLKLRGHPLVWHKRNPGWLADAPELAGYIAAVMARYRLHSWDVVNEAILPGAPGNLRPTIWLEKYGPSYIDTAFHAARAADPKTLLVYNDWGCELFDPFRAATLDFLEKALARGVPIDAYGMQGHLGLSGAQVDQAKLRVFLDRLRAMGLRILITEHDVDDDGGPADIVLRDRAVADVSRRFLDVVLDNDAVIAVLTWGLSDRYLDRADWRRLPLDTALKRKPMWQAMSKAFSARG